MTRKRVSNTRERDARLVILKENVVLYARRLMIGTASQDDLFSAVRLLNMHLEAKRLLAVRKSSSRSAS